MRFIATKLAIAFCFCALCAAQTVLPPANGGTGKSGTSLVHNIAGALGCPDSSGSGTAQSCSTSPSYTPAAGDWIIYSTTTTNTGDVTVNVNSLGAKHVRKWLGAATLASGDMPSGVSVPMYYDGTYWETMTIGNAPSSGGLGDPGSNGVVKRTALNTTGVAGAHDFATALACADTSGSGTTQVCSTSPSFTPAAGDWIIYSTTTTNTGDVTVNVNSLGAKHVRKWLGAASLASGDLPSGVSVPMYYDGTYWEIVSIGNAPPGAPLRVLGYVFGDAATGSTLTTSEVGYITAPFACTITGWHIMLDAGTATVKTWRVNSGTALPTSSNSISTSGVSISTGTKIDSTTVTDFTSTAIAAKDTLGFNLSAVSTAKQLTFQLDCQQ